MNFTLNEETFLIYAIKNYDNPSCSGMKEFLDDLKSFKYLKRLFKRYKIKKELKERLIINHLVVLYNVFGSEATANMLFYKIDVEYWPVLKTFLLYLHHIKHDTVLLDGTSLAGIPIDMNAANILRKI